MSDEQPDYALGHSEQELERLYVQALAFEPLTRRFFIKAGIDRGMKVLDFGSGAGDVSFLAAELVGPSGSVTGIDASEDAVTHATSRAAAKGLDNVTFLAGDFDSMTLARNFDAVIGRLVLMYLPQPANTLRSLTQHLKPSGIVAFHEMDIMAKGSFPPAPLTDRARGWINEAFHSFGADTQTGPKLYSIYKEAGLPAPKIMVEGIAGGSESIVPVLLADVVRALFPVMEAHGIVSAEDVALETLEERVRAELAETNGIALIPPFFGAWACLLER